MADGKTKKTYLIAGFAGIGKTFLCKKYANVLDLESSLYFYDYSGLQNYDAEKMKGNPDRKPNPNFPENYINAIKENIGKYDYILIWLHADKIFPHYKNYGIDYEIFVPSKDALNEYYQRYIERGNSAKWASHVCEVYDKVIPQLREMGKPIVFLKSGETLESYLLSNEEKYAPLVLENDD